MPLLWLERAVSAVSLGLAGMSGSTTRSTVLSAPTFEQKFQKKSGQLLMETVVAMRVGNTRRVLENSMDAEIEAAAKWWADRMHEEYAFRTGFSGRPRYENHNDVYPSIIDRFEDALRVRIREHIKDIWRPDNPEWGSYLRALHCDYDVSDEHPLGRALIDAGIIRWNRANSDYLPKKTTMWINPGEVKVRHGHQQPIKTIYRAVVVSPIFDIPNDIERLQGLPLDHFEPKQLGNCRYYEDPDPPSLSNRSWGRARRLLGKQQEEDELGDYLKGEHQWNIKESEE